MIGRIVLSLSATLVVLNLAAAAPAVDKNAEKFLQNAIEGNLAEIELGNLAQDLLAAPVDGRVQASQHQRFPFLPVSTRAVRVVQTASGAGFWTINELHVLFRGRELTRSQRRPSSVTMVTLGLTRSVATSGVDAISC